MDSPTTGDWAGILFFAAAGVYFIQKAVRPNAVRRWSWGRAGEGAPFSRTSYAIWGSMFLLIAVGVVIGPPSELWVGLFLICFVILFAVGIRRTQAEKRRRQSS
jgi:hypothetical protein